MPLRESEWDRRGHGVAVAIEVDHDALERQAESLGDGVDDAAVGLVRHHPGDVFQFERGALEQVLGDLGHADDGGLEHRRAILDDEVPPERHGFRAGGCDTATGRNVERGGALAIHVADVFEDADLVAVALLYEHDAGAVAEEDGGGAVCGIDHARHAIGAADEHAARGAPLHQLRRSHQRVDEAGARAREVEAPGVGGAELGLQDCGGRWDRPIGRHGRHDDAIERGGLDAAHLETSTRGGQRQIGRAALGGEAAFRDAGALANPRVGRVQSLLEPCVGIDVGRNVMTGRGDCGFWHDIR